MEISTHAVIAANCLATTVNYAHNIFITLTQETCDLLRRIIRILQLGKKVNQSMGLSGTRGMGLFSRCGDQVNVQHLMELRYSRSDTLQNSVILVILGDDENGSD